jgi:hypothetical protein
MPRHNNKVRNWLISDVKIATIRSELLHMRQNMISTTDTEASYSQIIAILNSVQGVD